MLIGGKVMFKVSSKGRYGVKAVYELSLHFGDGPLTVSSIAHQQSIPEQYLEQLMPSLKRAGLVKAIRGAQGGYVLSSPPATVSVKHVVRAVEGPILVADCATEEGAGCDEMDRCIGPDVWVRVQEAVEDAMGAITFQDLVLGQREQVKRKLLMHEGSGA